MIIEIRDIPEEGIQMSGEIDHDIFGLDPKDARFDGPLHYDFYVSIVSESFLAQGKVSVGFKVNCVRCVEEFRQVIALADCVYTEPIEGQSSIDLTDAIREDILLALPVHPHCEDGDPPKDCPQLGQFEKEEGDTEAESPDEPEKRDVWGGLEGFQPKRD